MIPDTQPNSARPVAQTPRSCNIKPSMRRLVSIFLLAFFSLGPFAATLEASRDARLPACCRRHGAHHCAMAAAYFVPPGAPPQLAPPAQCPLFPGSAAASTAPVHALPALAAGLPVLLAQPHSPAAGRSVARLSQWRTRSNRGPPDSSLA